MAVKLDLDTLDHLLGVGDDAAFKGIPSLKPAQDAASSFVTGVSSPDHHAATAPKPIAPPAASTPPKFFTGPQPIGTSAAPTSMPTLNPAVNSTAHPAAQPAPTSMPAIAPMGGSPEVAPMMTPMGAQGPSKPPESRWQKIGHTLGQIGGTALDIVAPGAGAQIPGTPLNKLRDQTIASNRASEAAKTSLETAQAGAVPSEIALRQAQTEAAKNPGTADRAKKTAELDAEDEANKRKADESGFKPGSPEYNRVRATGQIAAETPGKTPAEQVYAASIAAGKTPQQAFADSQAPPKDSASQDTERAEKIRQQQNLGQSVSAEDEAWLKGHSTEKTIGPAFTAQNRAEQGSYLPVPDPTDPIHKIIGWVDPKSGHFRSLQDIPGMSGNNQIKPTGQAASREEQASVIGRAGDGLIQSVQKNRDKVGNVKAIVESAFLGTPLADPAQAGLATEIGSFAALNPAMHGFRGTDALKQFEKLIGGIPNNPDALIASIKAIQKTAGYFNPNQGTSNGGNGGGGRQSVKDWLANRNK